MYEANDAGESVLFEVFSPTTDLEISTQLLKLFIVKFEFDIQAVTKMPLKSEARYGNSAQTDLLY